MKRLPLHFFNDVEVDRARIIPMLTFALQQGYGMQDIYKIDETSFFNAINPQSDLVQC